MFCSECGARAEGKFCWKCGAPLRAPVESEDGGGARPDPTPRRDPEPAAPPADWSREVRYEVLIAHPVVRDLLARQGALAQAPLSAEALMKLFDKLSLTPVPIETIAQIGKPLTERLGLKSTARTRAEVVDRPCGHALAAVLSSFARRSQVIARVEQADDGCTLHAELPSDFRSFQGELVVTLKARDDCTHVEAVARSRGQLYDWGKSQAALDQFFADLREIAIPG